MIVSLKELRQLLSSNIPVALVLGCEGLTALSIIRCLAKAHIPSLGISFGSRIGLAGYSKYGKVVVFPERWTEDNLSDLLMSGLSDRKGVIFCATDSSVVFVDKNRRLLSNSWHIFGSRKFRSADLMDKNNMLLWAKKAGFAIPRTVVINPNNSSPIENIGLIKPPCLLKPINSLKFGKEAFRIIYRKNDIFPTVSAYILKYGECLLQEFIGNATAAGMIEVLVYKPKSGNYLPVCTISKIRQYPFSIGSSSFIKTARLPGVLESISKYLSLITYTGIVDFELRRWGKQVYFLEINLRCGTPIYLSARSGPNLPQIAYRDILGENTDSCNIVSLANNIYWLRDDSDWKHVFEGRLTFWQFIRDVIRADVFAIFSWHDMVPFIQYLIKSITRKVGFYSRTYNEQ